MYAGRKIIALVPAHNEKAKIGRVVVHLRFRQDLSDRCHRFAPCGVAVRKLSLHERGEAL